MSRLSPVWRVRLRLLLPVLLLVLAVLLLIILSAGTVSTGLIVVIVATAVVAVVAAHLSARKLAQSLAQIRVNVERIAQISGGRRAQSVSDDSISSLVAALHGAARQLQDRSAELARRSQEHDTIVSSMIEGVLVVDVDQKLISVNPAARRLLGIEGVDVLGRSLLEIIRNSDLQRLVEQTLELGAAIEGDITMRGVEDRFLQVTGTVLHDATQSPIGVLIVLNDISRLRKLEQVRRDFVANVSHELKTPITSIKGYVETLLDDSSRSPEETDRFLNVIARQANRLNAIIEDLLRLSRIEQGVERGEIVLEKAALKGLLAAAIATCESRVAARNISVSLSCPDTLAARISAPLLEQAIVNLVDNAAKYGNEGTAIEVSAVRDNNTISITVRDHGIGIAPEHLSRLFERFYRVDRARSRAEGGTGLGLAITKHIVLAHGGTISVSSRIGEGSSFTITLPSD